MINPRNVGSQKLLITVVDIEPGAQQRPHSHEVSEQMYYILEGEGEMMVGDEKRRVEPDTAILIPPRTNHSLRNTGKGKLRYLSATTPPLDIWKFYEKQ